MESLDVRARPRSGSSPTSRKARSTPCGRAIPRHSRSTPIPSASSTAISRACSRARHGLLAAAGGERDRQLRQDRAARAGQDRARPSADRRWRSVRACRSSRRCGVDASPTLVERLRSWAVSAGTVTADAAPAGSGAAGRRGVDPLAARHPDRRGGVHGGARHHHCQRRAELRGGRPGASARTRRRGR